MQATKHATATTPDFCIEEYEHLYRLITSGDTEGALQLVCELDEMSRKDHVKVIENQIHRLLQHLVKRHHQAKYEPGRETNHSWIYSINDAVRMIRKQNDDWHYVKLDELRTVIESEYQSGLGAAADELGLTVSELEPMVERQTIVDEAYDLISAGRRIDKTTRPYGL